MKQLSSRLIALVLALCAGSTFAQAGVYVTGGLGQGMADFNGTDFPTDPDFGRRIDDKDTTWNIGFGYRLHRNVAVELGYVSLGEYHVDYTGTGAFAGETANNAYEVDAWKLAAVGIFPVMEQLSLIGKLGVALTKAESRYTEAVGGATVASESASKSKATLVWGLGAQYDFTRSLGVRAEYENYGTVGSEITDTSGTGRAKVSSFNLNLVYSFQ